MGSNPQRPHEAMVTIYKPRTGLRGSQSCWHLFFGLQAFKNHKKIDFCCSNHPACGISSNRAFVLAILSAPRTWAACLLVQIQVLDQLSPLSKGLLWLPYLKQPGSPILDDITLFHFLHGAYHYLKLFIFFSEPSSPLKCKHQKSKDLVCLLRQGVCDIWLRAGAQCVE